MQTLVIAFLSGNAFEGGNVANYHNDHIRRVGVSGPVMYMYTCVAPHRASETNMKRDSTKGAENK